MKYEIVNLQEYSGDGCTIYTIIWENDSESIYDKFIEENDSSFPDELNELDVRLEVIGKKGAREQWFKTKEGSPGDLVCALYDDDERNLRLYCIRFGSVAVIIGGGGPKPANIKTWQDDPKLSAEVRAMIRLSKHIFQRLKDGNLYWSQDGKELLGDLDMSDYE